MKQNLSKLNQNQFSQQKQESNIQSLYQHRSPSELLRDSYEYIPKIYQDNIMQTQTNQEQLSMQKKLDDLKVDHQRELRTIEQQLKMELEQYKNNQPNEQALDKLQVEFNEFKHKIIAQQNKMKDLDNVQGKQITMIETQEKKWKTLLQKLEVDYRKKIEEFESILKMSEEKAQEFDDNRKILKQPSQNIQSVDQKQRNMLVDDLIKKLNQQKVTSLSKLQVQEEIYKKKESELDQWVKREQEQNQEIKKKEELIKNFKQLLDHMSQEKELITVENDKIKMQLTQIKNLFKEKLPQLGIDPNLFDLDDEQLDDDEEVIVEEEKQDEDNSTEVEDNQE